MCRRTVLPGGINVDFSYVCGVVLLITWLVLTIYLIKDYFCDCFNRLFPTNRIVRKFSHSSSHRCAENDRPSSASDKSSIKPGLIIPTISIERY
uniref:ATP synthase F0 subunit 8 n=1 Tax=Plectus sambesii TaxID=2011161 RepID=A0A914V0S4_9BILA